jgi:hypothetical protein
MPERRSCPAGHEYWFPGERWQHEKCVVVNHQESVTTASNVVVNERSKDRHKKTPERLEYVKQKMREYRKKRA